MPDTRRIQHAIVSGNITIVAENHELPAFWAHPQMTGTFPGLVLIHENRGLTIHIRTCVRRLAEAGFYVIAPDLFDRHKPADEQQALAFAEQLGEAGIPRVAAALGVLQHHNHCNGQVGVVGWQMGGDIALHLAMYRQDLRAAVVFYAVPDKYLPMMSMEEAPLLAFYGDADPRIPKKVLKQMNSALKQSPGGGQVVIYRGIGSDFFDETVATYNPMATADAWERMIAFLSLHLEPPRLAQAKPI